MYLLITRSKRNRIRNLSRYSIVFKDLIVHVQETIRRIIITEQTVPLDEYLEKIVTCMKMKGEF